MKKMIASLIALFVLVSCLPLSACATTVDISNNDVLEEIKNNAYAVITDENGNIIQNLDIDVDVSQSSQNQRDTGTTYTVTYTARTTKADSGATEPKDGVTATGTITWNDIWGTTNSLVTVSGTWTVGDETISNRSVKYGAKSTQNELIASFAKAPEKNDFSYSPSNCTGYLFYLNTSAKINSTGNYIYLYVQTSVLT